jgi:pyruvate ferredoxin oxidoreductase gamma subunit
VIEIRWHARAGQGAKTASQIYAIAMLRAGSHVQAFPEYGPERRGAPLRAYTRVDERPIRRHDAIDRPDVVVVLEPSLLHEASVTEGLKPGGLLIANAHVPPDITGARRIVCVRAGHLAESSQFVNLVMLGALAAELEAPPFEDLVAGAVEVLGRKVPEDRIRAALETGYREVAWAAA